MKKVKIFMTVAVVVMAIGGAFATKTGKQQQAFRIVNNTCTATAVPEGCDGTGIACVVQGKVIYKNVLCTTTYRRV